MDFTPAENIFHATTFIVASIACLARIFRDDERINLPTIFGRCISSGVLGFGTVALWLGGDSNPTSGAYYWLAIAALIGYCSRDIQDQVLSRAVGWLLKKFGGQDDAKQ